MRRGSAAVRDALNLDMRSRSVEHISSHPRIQHDDEPSDLRSVAAPPRAKWDAKYRHQTNADFLAFWVNCTPTSFVSSVRHQVTRAPRTGAPTLTQRGRPGWPPRRRATGFAPNHARRLQVLLRPEREPERARGQPLHPFARPVTTTLLRAPVTTGRSSTFSGVGREPILDAENRTAWIDVSLPLHPRQPQPDVRRRHEPAGA